MRRIFPADNILAKIKGRGKARINGNAARKRFKCNPIYRMVDTKVCTSINFHYIPKGRGCDDINSIRYHGGDPPILKDIGIVEGPDNHLRNLVKNLCVHHQEDIAYG
jgi:hypothetical protein